MLGAFHIQGDSLSTDTIIVTAVSSLASGIIAVVISMWYFYKLERHKLKLDLARRLVGNRYNPTGDAFSCALNEVIVVFADAEDVLTKWARLFEALQMQGKPLANDKLLDFLKAVCKESGLT